MKISKTQQLKLDQTKNNAIQVSFNSQSLFVELKDLSPKKLAALATLKKDTDKLKYLLSLNGVKTKDINFVKRGSHNFGIDTLENRNQNHFLNLLVKQSDNDKFKAPITKAFHFGIEIECFIPFKSLDISPDSDNNTSYEYVSCYTCEGDGELTYTHRDSGFETEGTCPSCEGSGEIYNDEYDSESSQGHDSAIRALKSYLRRKAIKGLHVQTDSSIDAEDDHFSVEISCLTTDFKNLKKLCDALKTLEAKVNPSCGLHVHLDMRSYDESKRAVIKNNMKYSLDMLSALVPYSRRVSSYCLKRVDGEKYSAFNLCPLDTYGTIECRLHSGSTDFEKIKNWCSLLKCIVDATNVESITYTDLVSFCDAFDVPQDLQDYYELRYKKFNSNKASSSKEEIEDSEENENDEVA